MKTPKLLVLPGSSHPGKPLFPFHQFWDPAHTVTTTPTKPHLVRGPPTHPSPSPPGGGARSSSGPKALASAWTAVAGEGALRATRPRCCSRNRSVSAWCSGSVGGSSTSPTGPATSAGRDSQPEPVSQASDHPGIHPWSLGHPALSAFTPQRPVRLCCSLRGQHSCRQRQQEALHCIVQGGAVPLLQVTQGPVCGYGRVSQCSLVNVPAPPITRGK